MADTIYLRVGNSDRITLGTFIDSLRDFKAVLENLDATLSRSSQGSIHWEVSVLEKNSPPLIGVTPKVKRGRDDISFAVEKEFINNARLLTSKGERTEHLSDSALGKFQNLAGRTAKIGPMSVFINGDGPVKAKVDISEVTYQKVRQLTGVKYSAYGSVFGSLDSISIHSGNEFRIWSDSSHKPIRCRFPQDDLDRVKEYLGQRVMVAGAVQSNAAGNPISIDVRELEPSVKPALPTIEEMSGLIDDFTAGLSLREYMEQLSDE